MSDGHTSEERVAQARALLERCGIATGQLTDREVIERAESVRGAVAEFGSSVGAATDRAIEQVGPALEALATAFREASTQALDQVRTATRGPGAQRGDVEGIARESQTGQQPAPPVEPERAPADPAAVWEAHMAAEFAQHDVGATMATMNDDPTVYHVPVLTGGHGRAAVEAFYRDHFIPRWPRDVETELISRTVGDGRVVDERIVRFTHDVEMDFMLPGIPPSGRRVELPHVVVCEVRDGKVASEHIYWDQASVLAQVGALDAQQLPVTGAEQAHGLKDAGVPLNELIDRRSSS